MDERDMVFALHTSLEDNLSRVIRVHFSFLGLTKYAARTGDS